MRFARALLLACTILNIVIVCACSPDCESVRRAEPPFAESSQGRPERQDLEVEPLPIIVLKRYGTDEIVNLPNDYGFLIGWNNAYPHEFYLYDKPKRKIRCTSDFSAFLAGLRDFPSGARVNRIRFCASFESGMPKSNHQRLEEVFQAKQFNLTDAEGGQSIVCTCETREIIFLKTASEPILTMHRENTLLSP
jgi:hypothetical protein